MQRLPTPIVRNAFVGFCFLAAVGAVLLFTNGSIGLGDVAIAVSVASLLCVGLEVIAGRQLRRAERELRAREERYQLIGRATTEAIWDRDLRTGKVDWGDGVLALFGYAGTELRADATWHADHIHPEDRERVEESIRSVIDGGWRTWSDEYRFLRADGAYAYVTDRGYVVRDKDGTALRMVGAMRDVTEREEVGAQLRTSEEQYRALVEEAADPIIIFDRSGTVSDANNSATKFLGYSRDDLVGLELGSLLTPKTVAILPSRLEQLSAGITLRGEIPLRRRSGEDVWVESTTKMLGDGRIEGIFRDVSARRAAEQLVRLRARQQEAIARLGRIALSGAAIQALIDEAAETVRESLPADFCGVMELLPGSEELIPRGGAGWSDDGAHELTGPRSHSGYTLMVKQPVIVDDLRTEARFNVPPYGIEQGAASGVSVVIANGGAAFGVLTAYSRSRRRYTKEDVHFAQAVANVLAAAIARRQAEEDLRSSEEQLRTLVENAPEAIVMLDADSGKFIEANQNAADLAGLPLASLLESGPSALSAETQTNGRPSADVLDEQVTIALGGGTPVFDWLCQDATGRQIPCEVRLVRLPAPGRNLVRGSITDVGERKKLEAQFVQAQKMEGIGRLAGGVAHDFNNLMTAVIGYADLVLMSSPPDDLATDDVREIRATAERAASLAHQLLAFSRREVVAPRVVNVNELLQRTERVLRRLIGEDIDLEVIAFQEEAAVRVDPNQLEQVLINLAVNARDAMPYGGKLTIEIRRVEFDEAYVAGHAEAAVGPHVMIAVTDTGTGMSADVLAHVFEPFFTTKEAGRGTGLGLATSYGIVKQAGGEILVYSEPGIGSVFKIYLPAVSAGVSEDARSDADCSLRRGDETILVVEDEPAVRHMAGRVLRDLGYEVLEAADGEEALAVSSDYNGYIDLVLTDVIMPRLGGEKLARGIREARPDTRVLFTSGYPDDAILRHGVIENEVPYLQKPFSPLSLSRKVREVLEAPPN